MLKMTCNMKSLLNLYFSSTAKIISRGVGSFNSIITSPTKLNFFKDPLLPFGRPGERTFYLSSSLSE